MKNCDKRITNYTTGKVTICGSEVFEGTFCKYHWKRRITKMQLFGDRIGYVEPTVNEMKSGIVLYLKTKPSYAGHVYRGGFIYNKNSSTSAPPSKWPADNTLFVIKTKN